MMIRKITACILATIVLMAIIATAIPASAAGPNKTALTINAPTSVYVGQTLEISGKLIAGTSGTGVMDMKISVYRSLNGKKWDLIGTCLTGSGGYYKITTSEGTTGNYQYRATFSGNKIYQSVTSAKTGVTVKPKIVTSLVYTVSPNPSYAMEPVTTTVKLVDANGIGIPDQAINYQKYDDVQGWVTGSCPTTDAAGVFTFTLQYGAGFDQNLRFTYDGNDVYATATSNEVHFVTTRMPTTLTFTIDPNPAYVEQSLTESGKLTDAKGQGIPGKKIQLQVLRNGEWVSIADYTTTTGSSGEFDFGPYSVTQPISEVERVVFAGDSGYLAATSNEVNRVITKMPTTLDLAVSPNPATSGEPITFSGTLTGAINGGIPDETITLQFTELSSGTVFTETTKTMPVGGSPGVYQYIAPIGAATSFKVKAIFDGTSRYLGATSEEVTFTVNSPPAKLDTPIQTSPTKETVIASSDPAINFMWAGDTRADSYLFELQKYDATAGDYITDISQTVPGYYSFERPSEGYAPTYRWRVTAHDSTGYIIDSDPSAWCCFSIGGSIL